MTAGEILVVFVCVGWAASTLDLGFGRWVLRLLHRQPTPAAPRPPRRAWATAVPAGLVLVGIAVVTPVVLALT